MKYKTLFPIAQPDFFFVGNTDNLILNSRT